MPGPIDPNVSSDTPALSVPALQSGSVSVGSSATLICVLPPGVTATITNGSAAVHLGGSGVTTGTGFTLAASTSLSVQSGKNQPLSLYGICSTTSSVTYVYTSG